ncbi:MAG: DUF58 domain-containing protein, partial [Chloroflexi bacterium]
MQLTPRGLLLLFTVALILAAGTWAPAMQWVAIGYLLLLLLLLYFDWRRALSVDQRFEIHRIHDQKLSFGADNPIKISVRNRSTRTTTIQLRDEPPDQFRISTRILEATIPPRETWSETYHVHPLRRGDYTFG